jgi:hypothetical protein
MGNVTGMNERTLIAALVLQSVLVEQGIDGLEPKEAAKTAVVFADALIEALEDQPAVPPAQ